MYTCSLTLQYIKVENKATPSNHSHISPLQKGLSILDPVSPLLETQPGPAPV